MSRGAYRALFVSIIGFTGVFTLLTGLAVNPDFFDPGRAHINESRVRIVISLVESHRLRHGRYPERLSDLCLQDGRDSLAVHGVRYCTDAAGSRYFVALARDRRNLTLPPELWRGTGYDPNLGPCGD